MAPRRLQVETLWLLPALHRPVVSDAEKDPAAERIRERAGSRTEPGRLGQLLLALDKQVLTVAYKILERGLIEVGQ